MSRGIPVLLVCISIVACSGPELHAEPTEVELYVSSFEAAFAAGDLNRVMPFFSDDSSVRLVDVERHGLRQIDLAMGEYLAPAGSEEIAPIVFVGWGDQRPIDLMALGSAPASRCGAGSAGACDYLHEIHLDGDLIAHLATAVPMRPKLDEEAVRAYREYADAWSSGEPALVSELYGGLLLEAYDPILGMSVTGPADVEMAVRRVMIDHPGMRWEPVTRRELRRGGSAEPAVFRKPAEYADVRAGVYRVTSGAAPPLLVMVVWWLESGVIRSSTALYEVRSLMEAAEAWDLDAAGAWWSGLVAPQAPRVDCTVSGVLPVDGVEVCNATAELEETVAWGFGRFVEAGLDPPRPSSISFPPNARCRQVGEGWALDTGQGVDVVLCRVDDLERLRFVLLHELGHVWSNQHLDDATRDAFIALRGLESWRDPDEEWRDQGSEHAAEILAWGLMVNPVPMRRLPDAACDRLAEGFRRLTGVDPLVDPDEC